MNPLKGISQLFCRNFETIRKWYNVFKVLKGKNSETQDTLPIKIII